MIRTTLIVAALFLGCVHEPAEATKTKEGSIKIGQAECDHVTVDGMDCIYCETYDSHSWSASPALTCDWSMKKVSTDNK